MTMMVECYSFRLEIDFDRLKRRQNRFSAVLREVILVISCK